MGRWKGGFATNAQSLIFNRKVGDDPFDPGALTDERQKQLAVQFVANGPVDGHDAFLDIKVKALHAGHLQVLLEGVAEAAREGAVFERLSVAGRVVATQAPARAVKLAPGVAREASQGISNHAREGPAARLVKGKAGAKSTSTKYGVALPGPCLHSRGGYCIAGETGGFLRAEAQC